VNTSEYLRMFLAESRENLQSLNLAVIRLEEDPEDRATVDEIFRIAHTLKGMSATMGFTQIAALTHKMEDVFEQLRQRKGSLEREVVDVLFECLDALSEAVDSIDSDGSENLDPTALIGRLLGLIRDADEHAAEAAAEAAAAEAAPVLEPDVAGNGHVSLRIELAADVMMPSVRAFMVLAAAGDHGEVVKSVPEADAIDGFDGRVIEVVVSSEHETEVIVASLSEVPDVASVTLTGAPAAAQPPVAAEPAAPAAEPAAPAAPADAPAAQARPAEAEAPRSAQRKTSTTVRVDAERLDQLMHLMSELVVHRTHVESLVARSGVPGLGEAVGELTRSSQALQSMVMQVRMIPVEAVFMRFPRLVRDLSSKLDKQVELVLTGRETELDRTVIDAVGDPLVHLVRNSLDHALEPPEERVAAGKPATGTLEIAARHAGGNVVITVRDDGRGIDPARVARKAADRGLIPAEAVSQVDMPRAIELLFAPGFSTVDKASDLSGRGVGMDAVRNAIRELGGNVIVQSQLGAGTSVQIRLPLTLAIMPALLVQCGELPFAIPLERVERTLDLEDQVVRSVAGRPMLVLGDGVLPMLDLTKTLGYEGGGETPYAVIAHGGDRRLALAVGSLVGQYELVTRPLPKEIGDAAALSGGAVLASGEIALIVDCDALAGETGAVTGETQIAA
jgi:two-component system, chemotaxis family, sensor kinase CheA